MRLRIDRSTTTTQNERTTVGGVKVLLSALESRRPFCSVIVVGFLSGDEGGYRPSMPPESTGGMGLRAPACSNGLGLIRRGQTKASIEMRPGPLATNTNMKASHWIWSGHAFGYTNVWMTATMPSNASVAALVSKPRR